MPEPKQNESKNDFIERCMSNEEAKKDFPDEDQRLAFCMSQFENRGDNMKLERRHFEIEDLETRNDEESKPIITGYAAKFEKLSQDLGGFKEKIRRGAFEKSIRGNNIKALWNHNTDIILGSTKNNSLKLWEDEKGLRFELEMPNTTAGRDAYESIRRGDVEGVSFGFNVVADEWEEKEKKSLIRTLAEVILHEISPTAFPAYQQTNVGVRSITEILESYKPNTEIQGDEEKDYIKQEELRKLKLLEMELNLNA